MPKKELSIIIPCYNCSGTLEEALNSCFRQGLGDFEIVMVNDCSTDDTKTVMERLAKKHPQIRIFHHEKNMGGGATRNTAVSHAESDVIFCLDSDDILGDDALSKMLSYLHKNRCDGVGVSTSIKFKGKNKNDVAFTNDFNRVGEKIQFEDLFEKNPKCSLYSVFMHTKRAFDITGGYPTDHGFDTQGFAFKFLANGLVAHTCPDTTYFHRVNYHKSYYIREYEGGKVDHNWLKIYEEFLYLFNEPTQRKILGFDFKNSKKGLSVCVNESDDIFISNYRDYITSGSKEKYAEQISRLKKNAFSLYWLGVESLRRGKFREAIDYLSESKELGLDFPVVSARMMDAFSAISGKPSEKVIAAAKSFYTYTTKGSKAPFHRRVWGKIKRIFNI